MMPRRVAVFLAKHFLAQAEDGCHDENHPREGQEAVGYDGKGHLDDVAEARVTLIVIARNPANGSFQPV